MLRDHPLLLLPIMCIVQRNVFASSPLEDSDLDAVQVTNSRVFMVVIDNF
jgi:hypothetical protein